MKNTRNLIYRILLALLSLAMIVVSCIFLQSFNRVARVLTILLFTILFLISCFIESKYKATIRISTVILIFCSVLIIAYVVFERIGWIRYFRDFDVIRDFILSTKQWGIIIFLILTVLQVVLLPIPAAVTILIGVAIYGPFWAFVLSLVGTYIGSVICFWLGKSFGSKLVTWMIGKENSEKYANMLNKKGKWIFVLMLLFPFFPDDTLCLVAGTTKMSWKFFLLSVILARPLTIAFTSFFGSGEIIPFSGWGIPVWIGIFVLSMVLVFVANKVKGKLIGYVKKKKANR